MKSYEYLGIAPLIVIAIVAVSCGSSDPPSLEPRMVIDLSPVTAVDSVRKRVGTRTLNFLGTDGAVQYTPVVPRERRFQFGMETVCLLSHGGAHVDAPVRLLRGGEHAAQIGLDRMVGPARIVDLRWHDRNSPIGISHLEMTPIHAGDVVLLYVGYEPPEGDTWPRYAYLSRQASEWLVAKRVRAVATDMPTIGSFEQIFERLNRGQTAADVWAEYIPLFQAGIPVIAGLVNLDFIVDERNVLFVGLPLPLHNGTGAPIRATALVF